VVRKEVLRHRAGFVMLENVPIGICNICGYRYYHSTILKKVADVALGIQVPDRTENIPVACILCNTLEINTQEEKLYERNS